MTKPKSARYQLHVLVVPPGLAMPSAREVAAYFRNRPPTKPGGTGHRFGSFAVDKGRRNVSMWGFTDPRPLWPAFLATLARGEHPGDGV